MDQGNRPPFHRSRNGGRLGAILAIDAVGYSLQMARDEEATLRTLQVYRELIAGLVARHGGRVFGVAGDSEMAVLPHALPARATSSGRSTP